MRECYVRPTSVERESQPGVQLFGASSVGVLSVRRSPWVAIEPGRNRHDRVDRPPGVRS